ncbi:hypothetical protein CSB69_1052 [Morganella morganii]|nr:hypothetical protein CSB69_1052 [Morganella morganii]
MDHTPTYKGCSPSPGQPVYQQLYLYTVLCFPSRYNYQINVTL